MDFWIILLFDFGKGTNSLGRFRTGPSLAGRPWRKEQTEDLQQVLRTVDSDIPLVLVSGNHDVGNAPTPETIAEFQRTWGDDYFSFWVGGVLFLVLNSQFLYDASRCPALKREQDRWLEQQLRSAGQRACRHAVVFQHIPLFLQSIGEDDDYFNLTKSVRKEMADKFMEAGRPGAAGREGVRGGGVEPGLERRRPDPSPGQGERGRGLGPNWVLTQLCHSWPCDLSLQTSTSSSVRNSRGSSRRMAVTLQ